jgi:membrane protein
VEEPELRPLPHSRAARGVYLMARRYLGHNVSIQSAALAFYLLFTIFPLLIFFSALLGLLHLDVTAILADLGRLLPAEVVELVGLYLSYVGANPSLRLLVFGLFFSIYFPMRATNTLMRAVRTAYHLGPPRSAVRHLLRTLLFTLLLIVTITLMLVFLTVGNLLLGWAVEVLGLSASAARLWARLRFPAVIALMYLALYSLYALSQDTRQPPRNIFPGVLAALAGWLLLSLCYSYYVENFASYATLYGSIGAVVVLMVWLSLSATVLILGAELNGTLISLRKDRGAQE